MFTCDTPFQYLAVEWYLNEVSLLYNMGLNVYHEEARQ